MLRDAARAVTALLLLTVLCGAAYPLVVWGVGQAAFGDRADGSPVRVDGRVVGSALVGQEFTSDRYFHGRPSAVGYAAEAPGSGGSNLGPNSRDLADGVAALRIEVAAREGIAPGEVPVDLVTASASGLDPDISEPAALIQVPRVARARGLRQDAVRAVVAAHVREPVIGLLGARRVRVLELNLALDRLR